MDVVGPIPSRSQLIRRVESANRIAAPWVVVQLLLCALLAWGVDWRSVVEMPLLSVLAVAVIVGPHLMAVLRQWALPKKNIDDLKEQTRYGEFDKHTLRRLVDDALLRLKLPLPGPPVYVTADKTLNAGALHLGLGGFFRSLNGVYLNRQVLHRLTAAELQDIIGHELGHFYRYYLLNQRFQSLTLLLGALAGLLVSQWIGMSGFIGLIALTFCGSAAWFVSDRLYARNAEAIEYLCDDFGAQVRGVVVSINGLLKVGADGELHAAVHQQELLSRRYQNLNARDVIEAVSSAVPYGHTSREELQAAVEQALRQRSQARRRLSLTGFWQFAWRGDEDLDVDDDMEKIRRMQSVPRLDWESLLDRPGTITLDERRIAVLVAMLEAHPEQVLVRLPEELGDSDDVHPPLRMRILYLWKHRREIEGAAAAAGRD